MAAVRIPAHAPLAIPGKVALVTEIAATYVQVRLALSRHDLRDALLGLRRPGRGRASAADVAMGRRLGRAVGRTLGLLPADSRCLTQSLVLTRLLARRGIETSLVIAVRPGERFAAHAWIEYRDVPLLPVGDAGFEQLVKL